MSNPPDESPVGDRTTMFLLLLVFAVPLLWCYGAYPLIMAMRAWLAPRPWRADLPASSGSISIVFAIRNGGSMVETRIANLLSLATAGRPTEVIVVCNGCTDDTEVRARAIEAADGAVHVLTSSGSDGKAGALNTGVARAIGDVVVFADARQRFQRDALLRLLEPFADPAVTAVSGRLLVGEGDVPAVEGVRWYWGLETLLRQAESRTGSVVGVTGAIYAVRREAFPSLPPNLILDDLYVPMQLVLAGQRVVLAPAALAFDEPSANDRQEFARKRRTMVGNLQLVRLLPQVLHPRRNPIFVRYVSHKLLRLASPICILGLVATAAFLPGPAGAAIFWLGVSGSVLGLLGLVLRWRALAVPAAVVLVQLAILAAFLSFRADAAGVWMAPEQPRGQDG